VCVGAASNVDSDVHCDLDGRRVLGDFGAARPDERVAAEIHGILHQLADAKLAAEVCLHALF
jgi:hypothetical protein